MNTRNMSMELKQNLGFITHDFQGLGNDPKHLYRTYQLLLRENFGLLPAQRMLERAAALDYGPACIDLATLYYNGRYLNEGFEFVQDEKKMVQWLRRAADHRDPQACLLMARCYCTGIGLPADEQLAYWYISRIDEQILRSFFSWDEDWDKHTCLNEISIIPTQILYLQTLQKGSAKK